MIVLNWTLMGVGRSSIMLHDYDLILVPAKTERHELERSTICDVMTHLEVKLRVNGFIGWFTIDWIVKKSPVTLGIAGRVLASDEKIESEDGNSFTELESPET
jgi:hypothetical protein